jgi:methionyl-tRNA synthetase
MSKSFYVTTPIYYVNDTPHIGHAYTTVAADVLARFKRLRGYDVFFLTGTDEHGQKVEKAASDAGITPMALADKVVVRYQELWKTLNISNDRFVRTTDEDHKKVAASLWETVTKAGDIYLSEYEDWYCTPCENFLTEMQLNNGKCPDCFREVERLKEQSYFFKLSLYGEKLLEYIEANPSFIEPEYRRNEVTSFLREGLRDLSLSRTTFTWGVPVPGNDKHVMYVWFDALTNYLSGAGFPEDKRYWPADVHIIGKDILRFHAVYWPAFLMSAGIAVPKKVFAHGWWTVDGKKMSKSVGNVVDPFVVVSDYGVDQFRYFLLREVPFGLDGDFSIKALQGRVNSDLANDLGNLVSRSISMIIKYRDGKVPTPSVECDGERPEETIQRRLNATLVDSFDNYFEKLQFNFALIHLWEVVRDLNRYIDLSEPWRLAKDEAESCNLSNVLYILAESLRILAVYLYPFMPASAEAIWERLGIKDKLADCRDMEKVVAWSDDISGSTVTKGEPLFPKIDIDKDTAE